MEFGAKKMGTMTKHMPKEDLGLKAHQHALADIDARLTAAMGKRLRGRQPKEDPAVGAGGESPAESIHDDKRGEGANGGTGEEETLKHLMRMHGG